MAWRGMVTSEDGLACGGDAQECIQLNQMDVPAELVFLTGAPNLAKTHLPMLQLLAVRASS